MSTEPRRPRYLVFAGDDYYPGGGWQDFKGAYLFLDDAKMRAADAGGYAWMWACVVDLDTMEEVWWAT